MSKRKWTNIKAIEPAIIAMREAGKTRREIAEHFGLKKEQIKSWVKRYNREQAKLAAGMTPRPKGRPYKNTAARDIVSEQAYKIKRLKMENKLLLDFLSRSGRM